MLPNYVVHAIDGRVRLRHPLFKNEAIQAEAKNLLKDCPEVQEVQTGQASLLLFLNSDANLENLCQKLEASWPELKESQPKTSFGFNLPELKKISPRRLEVRILTAASLLCALSGLFDSSKLHVLAGAAFAALTLKHIWTRRALL